MTDTPALPSETDQLRHNRELAILNAITEALHREVDLSRALHTVLAQVAACFDLHTGWIWLLSATTGEPYLAAVQHLPPVLCDQPSLMEGDCYCLRTYREGDLAGAANVNVVLCSRLQSLLDGTDGLRYHASIPLYASSNTRLGVLNVASRAQGLAAIALQLESAEALLEAGTDPRRLRRALTQALGLTRANLEEVRRSVLDLRAAPLEGRMLVEALAALLYQVAAEHGFDVDLTTIGGARPLSPRLEVGLYRMAQEAFTNVVKHAAARRVTISLVSTPTLVQMVIEDDGRGFDPAAIPPHHYGLIGLNERARLLGGSLRIESSRGIGTRLEVQLPLSAAEPQPHVAITSQREEAQ